MISELVFGLVEGLPPVVPDHQYEAWEETLDEWCAFRECLCQQTFNDGDDGVGRVRMAWVLALLHPSQEVRPERLEGHARDLMEGSSTTTRIRLDFGMDYRPSCVPWPLSTVLVGEGEGKKAGVQAQKKVLSSEVHNCYLKVSMGYDDPKDPDSHRYEYVHRIVAWMVFGPPPEQVMLGGMPYRRNDLQLLVLHKPPAFGMGYIEAGTSRHNQLANPEAYEEALGCMGGGRVVVAVGGRDVPVLRQAPPKVLSPSSPLKNKK